MPNKQKKILSKGNNNSLTQSQPPSTPAEIDVIRNRLTRHFPITPLNPVGSGDLYKYPDSLLKAMSIYSHQNASNTVKLRKNKQLLEEINQHSIDGSIHPHLKKQFAKLYLKPEESAMRSSYLHASTTNLAKQTQAKINILETFKTENTSRLKDRIAFATDVLDLSLHTIETLCGVLTNDFLISFNLNDAEKVKKAAAKLLKFNEKKEADLLVTTVTAGEITKLLQRIAKLELSTKKKLPQKPSFQPGALPTRKQAPKKVQKQKSGQSTKDTSRIAGKPRSTSKNRR